MPNQTKESSKAPEYPECEKLAKIAKQSRVCGEFLSWLMGHKEFELAKWADDRDVLIPVHYNTAVLLAEFFGIDSNKVEEERRQMIAALNKADN